MSGLLITDPVELHVALTSPQIIPGDTIYLRGGSYVLGNLTCNLRGTSGAHITIRSYESETVTLIPASGTRVLTITGAYLDFKTLIFDGTNVTDEAIKVTDGASNILLDGLEIKNAGRHGILASRTSGLTIKDCNIHHNGTDTSLDHGIYVSSEVTNVLVQDCTINDNTGYGAHFYGGETDKTYTITGNEIYNQANKAGIGCFHGLATVQSNNVHDCLSGIALDYSIVQAVVSSNTVAGCTNVCLYSIAPTQSNTMTIDHNTFSGCPLAVELLNQMSVTQTATLDTNTYTDIVTRYDIAQSVDVTRIGE